MPLDRHTRDLFYCRIISALTQQQVAQDIEALTQKSNAGMMRPQLAERLLLFFHQTMLDIREKYQTTAELRKSRRVHHSTKPALPTVKSNDNTNNALSADECESETGDETSMSAAGGDILQVLGSTLGSDDSCVIGNGDESMT